MKCTICGYENPEGAMYCKACGAALTPSQPESVQPNPESVQPQPESVQPNPEAIQPEIAKTNPVDQPNPAQNQFDQPNPAQNQFGQQLQNQFQGQNQNPFGQPNPAQNQFGQQPQNQFQGQNQNPFGQPNLAQNQNPFGQQPQNQFQGQNQNPFGQPQNQFGYGGQNMAFGQPNLPQNQYGKPDKKSKKPLIIGLIAVGVIALLCCIYFFILPMFLRGGAKKATKAGLDNIVEFDVSAMLDTTKDIPAGAYSAFYKVVEENDGTYLFDIYFDDDVKDGKDIKKEVDKILDACNDKDTLKRINKTINSADELTDMIEGAEVKVGATHKLRNTKQIINSIEKDINGNLDELFEYAKSQDPDLEDDELKKTKQEVKETFEGLKDSSYYEDIVKAGDSFIKKADDACLVDVTITYKKYTFKIQDICFKFDGEWVSVLGNLPSIYIIPAMYRYIDYVE